MKNDFTQVPKSTGTLWRVCTNRKDFSIKQVYALEWAYQTEEEALQAIDILDNLNCYKTFAFGSLMGEKKVKEIYSRFYHGKRKATETKTIKICQVD